MTRIRLIFQRIKDDIYRNRLALVILVLYFLLTGLLFGEVCPLKLLTGLPCPGCGLVRGCLSFLTFQFQLSFHYNLTAGLWIAGILYLLVTRYLLGKPCKSGLPVFTLIGCITIILYVWRMATEFPGDGAMSYYSSNLFQTLKEFNP